MDDMQRLTGYRGCDTLATGLHQNLDVAFFIVTEEAVIANINGHAGLGITKDYMTNARTLPVGTIVTADQPKVSGEGWFTTIRITSGVILAYDRPQKGKTFRPNQPNAPVA